jgi:hypothetical protein
VGEADSPKIDRACRAAWLQPHAGRPISLAVFLYFGPRLEAEHGTGRRKPGVFRCPIRGAE